MNGLRFWSPSGHRVDGDFPTPGRVVRREVFDKRLLDEAAKAGVEIREGVRVRALFPRRVETKGEVLEAPLVVAADGLHSLAHRLPEFEARRGKRYGMSFHVRGVSVEDRVEVFFGSHGEAYVAPAGDDVLVAVLGTRLPRKDEIEPFLRRFEALRPRIGRLEFTTPPLGAGPLGVRVGRTEIPGLKLIGDAAGAVDPISGEGMSVALCEAAGEDGRRRRQALRFSDLLLRLTTPTRAEKVISFLSKRPSLMRRILEVAIGERSNLGLLDRLTLAVGV